MLGAGSGARRAGGGGTGARRTSRPRARREHDAKSREIGSGSSPAWNRRAPRSYRSARADLIHCIPRHHVHAARYREPVAVRRVGRSHRGSSQGTGAAAGRDARRLTAGTGRRDDGRRPTRRINGRAGRCAVARQGDVTHAARVNLHHAFTRGPLRARSII